MCVRVCVCVCVCVCVRVVWSGVVCAGVSAYCNKYQTRSTPPGVNKIFRTKIGLCRTMHDIFRSSRRTLPRTNAEYCKTVKECRTVQRVFCCHFRSSVQKVSFVQQIKGVEMSLLLLVQIGTDLTTIEMNFYSFCITHHLSSQLPKILQARTCFSWFLGKIFNN